jgi:hypothetical protein
MQSDQRGHLAAAIAPVLKITQGIVQQCASVDMYVRLRLLLAFVACLPATVVDGSGVGWLAKRP